MIHKPTGVKDRDEVPATILAFACTAVFYFGVFTLNPIVVFLVLIFPLPLPFMGGAMVFGLHYVGWHTIRTSRSPEHKGMWYKNIRKAHFWELSKYGVEHYWITDTPYFVAKDDIEIPPLYGTNSIELLVPRGVNVNVIGGHSTIHHEIDK